MFFFVFLDFSLPRIFRASIVYFFLLLFLRESQASTKTLIKLFTVIRMGLWFFFFFCVRIHQERKIHILKQVINSSTKKESFGFVSHRYTYQSRVHFNAPQNWRWWRDVVKSKCRGRNYAQSKCCTLFYFETGRKLTEINQALFLLER